MSASSRKTYLFPIYPFGFEKEIGERTPRFIIEIVS